MKKTTIFLFVALAFCTRYGLSQGVAMEEALGLYDEYAYQEASEQFERLAKKGHRSVMLFQKLGNSYYFNGKMEKAAQWYGELMAMDEKIDPEYYFRYAQALKGIEKYDEANEWMERLYQEKSGDHRGQAFAENNDYLSAIALIDSTATIIRNLNINSPLSDFGTTPYKNQIVFASSRKSGRKYVWNNQPFLELYSASKKGNEDFDRVKELHKEVNSKYHESTAAFTPDGKYMFFTRNNFYKKKFKTDKQGTNRLKIYRATKTEDGWDDIVPVHFNSDAYSVAHPSINSEGTEMYFASDMPGTLGSTDIYVVEIQSDARLGIPKNLGKAINTEGRETFPFINSSGDLYFSSNGYPGLGGLDIYVVKNTERGGSNKDALWSVRNMGRPLNGPHDDFAYYENPNGEEGFFSSNRPGGKGDDDIYSFIARKCKIQVTGTVRDKNSLEPLPGAKVVLFDRIGDTLVTTMADREAKFSFEIDCNKEYLVRGEKEAYLPDEIRFTSPSDTVKTELELLLSKPIKVGDDLAEILDIPMIYFDFDKYNIRPDAELQLQKVLQVLKEHSWISLHIKSHTDCRGSYAYNERLSENRAKSTKQYLVNNGVTANRLTAKGYGEYELQNGCTCEGAKPSTCTEEEHQKNRRSEFIVVKKEK